MLNNEQLLLKYNVSTPRYTSYPAVPFWKNNLNRNKWFNVLSQYDLSKGIDLYIHIPFCHSLCWYCGCNRIISRDESRIKNYVDAILEEWKIYSSNFGEIKIKSVHFGGGTPNSMNKDTFEYLLEKLSSYFCEEFIGAIELDPRSLTKEFLGICKKFNLQRISFGIQDFDSEVQKSINRIQPYKMVKTVNAWARDIKLENLNYDLIYGLPKQSEQSINQTLNYIKNLKPDTIALYSYAHLPEQLKNQKLINQNDLPQGAKKRELYKQAKKGLEELGYMEIGLDHFALEDSYLYQAFKSSSMTRSFMGYTDKKAEVLIGLGASAISSTKESFGQNSKNVNEYLGLIQTKEIKFHRSHFLSPEELKESLIINRLMCIGKAKRKDIEKLQNSFEIFIKLKVMIQDGILEFDGKDFVATKQGRPFLRNVAKIFDSAIASAPEISSKFSTTA